LTEVRRAIDDTIARRSPGNVSLIVEMRIADDPAAAA
jgi:hypothetical protein